MLAYQFYCKDETGENHLIAILPERRRNPERITDGSILNWAAEVIGNGCHGQSIYFVEVTHRVMGQETDRLVSTNVSKTN